MSSTEKWDGGAGLAVIGDLVAAILTGAQGEHGVYMRRRLVTRTEETFAALACPEGWFSIAPFWILAPSANALDCGPILWTFVLFTEASAPSPSISIHSYGPASCLLTAFPNMHLRCQPMLSAARSRFISVCVVSPAQASSSVARAVTDRHMLLLSMMLTESWERVSREPERWGGRAI